EADFVKRVLDDAGFELDFWRVKMRPGSPVSFGWLPRGQRRQAVFGLPGNPSSAFVTFEVFVRPFLL
ncbi:MAG: molybdopterin molybdenumtransferase MoeA, partial [Gemmatimonadetes bacterium]|nr:molybdopterin molybdenumtransferase MoeA [Gemmatimonadota bacterium]NIU74028.1 molybdopterin molybdenumtransferase MoeA [Gammaproteobacteria bacterium]NIV86599.1 molybdopterin molybdenumtransferase MoeA [Actinomycetota bacterium]NIQ53861.1 molybdopterin molybdenumtransferase MoeA [Gemmatimonadota bacterium]NIX44096.1 molybdopterin molybdenumtransferase MoeA [Gemmatimonadota bacterium]